jgi:hypothetical protein
MSPVLSSTRTVPRAGLHYEVVESGPLLMISGIPVDAGEVPGLTGQLAPRSMGLAHDTRSDLTWGGSVLPAC